MALLCRARMAGQPATSPRARRQANADAGKDEGKGQAAEHVLDIMPQHWGLGTGDWGLAGTGGWELRFWPTKTRVLREQARASSAHARKMKDASVPFSDFRLALPGLGVLRGLCLRRPQIPNPQSP